MTFASSDNYMIKPVGGINLVILNSANGLVVNEVYVVQNGKCTNCPIRNVLARIGDKWSLLVLYNLQHKEPMRFKELQRQIPDISQKSLTQTLRTLKEDGFISREVFPEIPPRVEYSLTPRALSFLPLVENIINWAKENMEDIMADRAKNRC